MHIDYKNKGLRLIKKGQKGISHAIFSRFGLILFLLFIQVRFFAACDGRECIIYISNGRLFVKQQAESDSKDNMADRDYAASGIWRAFIFVYAKQYRAPCLKKMGQRCDCGVEVVHCAGDGGHGTVHKGKLRSGFTGKVYTKKRLLSGL